MNVIQIEFWDLMKMLAGTAVVLSGAAWTLGVIIVKQFTQRLDERQKAQDELRDAREKALDEKFRALESSIRQEGEGWRTVERELLQLKADLPIQYMRREDAIRQEVVIHAKLDALAAKIDALRIGG